MTVRRLCNLIAVKHEDPRVLDDIARKFQEDGVFGAVVRPADGWVAALSPLPGTTIEEVVLNDGKLLICDGTPELVKDSDNLKRAISAAWAAPERLAELPGDFGFLAFEPDGSLLAVRSCEGLVPVYLAVRGSMAAVTTQLGNMAQYLPAQTEPDLFALASFLGAGVIPEHRSFLEDVTLVPRGHSARLGCDASGWSVDRYWDPRPDSLPRAGERFEEHARALRDHLLTRLDRDLDPDGVNLLTLSGGVDSSTLGAIAAGHLGRKVATLTFFPTRPEDLARERFYVDHLASQVPLGPRIEFPLSWACRIELLKKATPSPYPIIHPALGALPEVVEKTGATTLFGGEFADEVCGSRFTYPDWFAHSPFHWTLRKDRRPLGPKDPARWLKRRWQRGRGHVPLPFHSELSEIFQPEFRERYAGWVAKMTKTEQEDLRPLRGLSLRSRMDAYVAMNWEAASPLAIRRLIPFMAREAQELVWGSHPADLVGPRTKRSLRRAVGDLVPTPNIERNDRGYLETVPESPPTPPSGPSEVVKLLSEGVLTGSSNPAALWTAWAASKALSSPR